MTTDASPQSRHALVAEIRQRLDRETFPRVIVLAMLGLAGAATFLSSVLALRAGVDSMAGRYALATAIGYAAFLALIRVWIAIRRGWRPDDVDVRDAFDLADDLRAVDTGPAHGVGGELASSFDWSFDLDELWWLVLAALALAAGLVVVAFVVYSAPVLLPEVALDAALVGTVYRRLARADRRSWASTALRRTWVSAVTLVTFMAVLGFALRRLAPHAISVGDVIRRFAGR